MSWFLPFLQLYRLQCHHVMCMSKWSSFPPAAIIVSSTYACEMLIGWLALSCFLHRAPVRSFPARGVPRHGADVSWAAAGDMRAAATTAALPSAAGGDERQAASGRRRAARAWWRQRARHSTETVSQCRTRSVNVRRAYNRLVWCTISQCGIRSVNVWQCQFSFRLIYDLFFSVCFW